MFLAALIGLSVPAPVTVPVTVPVTAPVPKVVDIQPICRNPGTIAADATPAAGIRPLGEEPPARHIKAVVREIDGCNTPVVVSARVGMPQR